jgi:hypothetical protein
MPEPAGDRLLKFVDPESGRVIWQAAEFRPRYEAKGFVVDESEVARWSDWKDLERETHRWHGFHEDRYWKVDPPPFPAWPHAPDTYEPPGGITWATPGGTQRGELTPLQPVPAPTAQAVAPVPVGEIDADGDYVPS